MSTIDTLTDADLEQLRRTRDQIAKAVGPKPDTVEWAMHLAGEYRARFALMAADEYAIDQSPLPWLDLACDAKPYATNEGKAAMWLSFSRQVDLFRSTPATIADTASFAVFQAMLTGETPQQVASVLGSLNDD